MEIKYLPTCEVGIPDGWGDVENCAEGSVAWVKFGDGSALYLCKKHLKELEVGIEESEE